jgi:hypothetical protein
MSDHRICPVTAQIARLKPSLHQATGRSEALADLAPPPGQWDNRPAGPTAEIR